MFWKRGQSDDNGESNNGHYHESVDHNDGDFPTWSVSNVCLSSVVSTVTVGSWNIFFVNFKSPKFDVFLTRFLSSNWMPLILSWSPPLPLQLCHPQEPAGGGFSARHFLSSWSRPTSLVLVLSISLVIKLKLIFCAVIMFFIILIIIINTNHEKVISTRQFMFGFVQSSFIPYHPHHQHGHDQHGHHQHGHHLLLGDPFLLRSTSSR